MCVQRLIDELVLQAIPGGKPAGDDLRAHKDWVLIRAARPRPAEAGFEQEGWQPATPAPTDWLAYKDLLERALSLKSKDLELALWLTEAAARIHGFEGVRDGLWMVRELIARFAGQGLLPEPEDGDLEAQYAKLDWLNEKLGEVVRELPLTMRSNGDNYSWNYHQEAYRHGGMITAAEFESAVAVGNTPSYELMLETINQALRELDLLEEEIGRQYGPAALSFTQSRQALEDCRDAVQSILRKRPASAPSSAMSEGESRGQLIATRALAASSLQDGWTESEALIRSGDIDRALAAMAALAAAEANGRVRFERRLLLADLCLQTNRKKLGKSILEELNELVEAHHLDKWETSEVVGAVWVRLVRCYRDRSAGTADAGKEAEFFHKLSRLDPWQAVACGEPAEESRA